MIMKLQLSERIEFGIAWCILGKEISILILKKNNFYAYKTLPYLVDGKEYFQKCEMAICFSCNQLVYFGIENFSVNNGLVNQFITKRFKYITFDEI